MIALVRDGVRTIDKARLEHYITTLDKATMKTINQALLASIGLKKQEGQPLVLCLCSICANQFYDNPAYMIWRLDPDQKEKDTCMYCNVRQGFDYEVRNK